MPRDLELAVVKLVVDILGGDCKPTPTWLLRPGKVECDKKWPLICDIYDGLTGLKLPDVAPSREWRDVDCVLNTPNHGSLIVEVDEVQHFNCYRAATLRKYSSSIALAFDPHQWIRHSESKSRLEGGGFAKPRPPLFRGDGGRHRQRAFRDALCDILPLQHGFSPTLRIAYFEVSDWIFGSDAHDKMQELVNAKLALF
jgi:hypothetical protein